MFYHGSLQEGISNAVEHQKLVLCFVTDENEEGKEWEDEFLPDAALKELINSQAVALRLTAGSEEAGYLAQIFPLPQTPTVVIIKNGELKEYVTPGVSKEDFIRRIQTAFSAAPHPVQSTSTSSATTTTVSQQVQQQQQQQAEQLPEQTQQSENVRRILAERAAARLQAEESNEDQPENQVDEDVTKENKPEEKSEPTTGTEASAARRQAEIFHQKQRADTDERQRILKRIEADKAERRQRAAEREKRKVENQKIEQENTNSPMSQMPRTSKVSDNTALQVRLFDGSTMRSRFPTGSTLRDVRKWIDDERRDGNLPYTFKHFLTPLPNKNIDETDEQKDLRDLGLAPSATLVLIPVIQYASAYESGDGGFFSQVVGFFLMLYTSLLTLLGLDGEEGRNRNQSRRAEISAAEREAKLRRLRDIRNMQNRARDQQLYNGNSLNFESQPNEDEKK